MSHLRTRAPVRAAPSDAELLRGIVEGDTAALGALYDRYAVDVWRTVNRVLVETSEAEDVVHAVFLNLPRLAASFDGRASCRPWLQGVAVRLAMRHRRGVGRFRRVLCSLAEIVAPNSSNDPERSASNREELAIFARALAGLSAKKRAAFVLADIEGFTSEEVARALEIPVATARTRLFHARRELDAALKRQETS